MSQAQIENLGHSLCIKAVNPMDQGPYPNKI